MRFSSFFALSVLATVSTATPTKQEVLQSPVDQTLSISLPVSYQLISQDTPNTSFQQSRLLKVSQVQGGLSNIDTLLRFTGIPAGSFGCQLALSFTFEFQINSTGNSQVNIYRLPNDIKPTDTYATYFPKGGRGTPEGASLFGTTTINGQKAIINSQVCTPNLNYLIEIASDTQAGSVAFVDAGNNLSGIGGFFVSYNA